jgi:O-antigen/teichoic acid export membrane protein
VSDPARTIRHAGLLLLQRGFHLAAAALFAVMVPRVMGPSEFGRYALITSVAMWFALASGLGATSMMTRVVPDFVSRNDRDGLARLLTNLLALRAMTGLGSALLYLLITTGWFPELDAVALVFVAASVWSRTVANPCYSMFLGLDQASRWGLGDLVRRWLTLAFTLTGFLLAGIRGACLGVLAANLIVLGFGLWWARAYVSWSQVRPDLQFIRPFLRIGAPFAAGNVLLALAQRSGEPLVRAATLNYAEVGYFGVAYDIFLAGAHAVWQLTLAFAPLLVALRGQDRLPEVHRWLERLLTLAVVVSSFGVIGALFLAGDLMPLVLGPAFQPVAANLVPMALALVALSIGCAGRVSALVLDRPDVSATAAALEIAVFWTLGWILAGRYGGFGACVAAALATFSYAAYVTWRMRREVPYSLGPALRALAFAAIVAPLAWLPADAPLRLALFAAAASGYAGLITIGRVVGRDDVAAIARAWRRSEDRLDAELDLPRSGGG